MPLTGTFPLNILAYIHNMLEMPNFQNFRLRHFRAFSIKAIDVLFSQYIYISFNVCFYCIWYSSQTSQIFLWFTLKDKVMSFVHFRCIRCTYYKITYNAIRSNIEKKKRNIKHMLKLFCKQNNTSFSIMQNSYKRI